MHSQDLSLDKLPHYVEAKVINVSKSPFANMILSMGLMPNTIISVQRKSLLGESLYLKVGTQSIAIREEQSKTVTVQPI